MLDWLNSGGWLFVWVALGVFGFWCGRTDRPRTMLAVMFTYAVSFCIIIAWSKVR